MLQLHSSCETGPVQVDKARNQHRPLLRLTVRTLFASYWNFTVILSLTTTKLLNKKLLSHRIWMAKFPSSEAQKTANGTHCYAVHILCQGGLHILKYHTVTRYTRKYNLSHVRDIRIPFTTPIFTKLTNAQQHCVLISYRNVQPNWVITTERTDKNSLTSQCK